jgi:uncharacterized Ntn-hydrolase superfamily protein
MTFSIAGRCAKSGAFGVAITTSSIAVGARCPHARAGVGAVATQNVTDPNLGPLLLDLMEKGMTARAAIDAVVKDRPFIDYRQLTAVDAQGNSASWSGQNILGTHGVSEQRDCVGAGNLLKHASLPRVMTDAFAANAGDAACGKTTSRRWAPICSAPSTPPKRQATACRGTLSEG